MPDARFAPSTKSSGKLMSMLHDPCGNLWPHAHKQHMTAATAHKDRYLTQLAPAAAFLSDNEEKVWLLARIPGWIGDEGAATKLHVGVHLGDVQWLGDTVLAAL
jgi:hypothetical protein